MIRNLYTVLLTTQVPIRFPNGDIRAVHVQKIKDTAGTQFYVFADSTPLFLK